MAAGDHGRVRLGHAELLEQLVHLRVGLQVHPGEQHPVLGQEVAHPEGVRGVARADDAQPGEAGRLAQELAAGDERLEDDVAQVRALVQHAPQALAGDLDDLAPAPRDGADERRGARQVGDFAGKFARAVNGDPPRLVARRVDDLDLARLDDEEPRVAVADGEQRLPVVKRPADGRRTSGQPGDLRRVERREGDGTEVVFGHASASLRTATLRQQQGARANSTVATGVVLIRNCRGQ